MMWYCGSNNFGFILYKYTIHSCKKDILRGKILAYSMFIERNAQMDNRCCVSLTLKTQL